jgi:hypothetical protein
MWCHTFTIPAFPYARVYNQHSTHFMRQELGGTEVEVGIKLMNNLGQGKRGMETRGGGSGAHRELKEGPPPQTLETLTLSQRTTEKRRIMNATTQMRPRMVNFNTGARLPLEGAANAVAAFDMVTLWASLHLSKGPTPNRRHVPTRIQRRQPTNGSCAGSVFC